MGASGAGETAHQKSSAQSGREAGDEGLEIRLARIAVDDGKSGRVLVDPGLRLRAEIGEVVGAGAEHPEIRFG